MVICFADPTGRYAFNRADSNSFPLVCNVDQRDTISAKGIVLNQVISFAIARHCIELHLLSMHDVRATRPFRKVLSAGPRLRISRC